MKYRGKTRKAIQTLLTHYEKLLNLEKSFMGRCVLCEATKDECYVVDCTVCPWVIETNKTCYESTKNQCGILRNKRYSSNSFASPYPQQTYTKWYKRRVLELKEWLVK